MSVAHGNTFYTLIDQVFADALPKSPATSCAEHLLLTDFLVCVTSAGADAGPKNWKNDGTTGYAATLAVRAHTKDRDDIHWATGVHPGSVIWPVVLALGCEVQADGELLAAAARTGYHAMATMARVLGPAHGRSWHVTATCGAFGSAAATARLLELDADERFWACSHAIAAAGGVGQALVERSGTTAFHRAAAAVIGIQAGRLAAAGLRSSAHALDGERGVLALLGQGVTHAHEVEHGATLETTSLRLYPVNGFAQAAVHLSARLRQRVPSGAAELIVVDVSAAVAAATTGDTGGAWWDLRGAVAAAWSTGDPFNLEPTSASISLRDRVRVQAGALRGCETRVTVHGDRSDIAESGTTPPGFSLGDPMLPALLERKWNQLLGGLPGGVQRAKESATALLSAGPMPSRLSHLLASRTAP